MNKHRKQTSREIKNIMRADKWGRTTYKEAKRQWKDGIRAFPIGPSQQWGRFYLAQLGFDRERLRELGQAVYMLMSYAKSKGMTLTGEYWPSDRSYLLKFRGKDISGKTFGCGTRVDVVTLRQYAGPLQDFARFIAKNTDAEITHLGVTPTSLWNPYQAVVLHDWTPTPVEPILGYLIRRRTV